jgi:hypothetical protein
VADEALDPSSCFDRALATALGKPEIVDAATAAATSLDDLEHALRDDEMALWRTVDAEHEALRRAGQRLDEQRRKVAATKTESSWFETTLTVLGAAGLLAVLAFAVAGAAYGVTALLSSPTWIFPGDLSGAVGAALGLGLAAIGVAGYLESRRPPQRDKAELVAQLDALDAQAAAAAEVLETALVEQVLLPELRRLIDERMQDSYAHELAVESAIGLAEPFDQRFEVATRARDELERILTRRSGASIGIAGPRGVGKTTLIEAVTRGSDDGPLCVRASAPVQYQPREFVLHLFALLCEAVLERHGIGRSTGLVDALASESRLRRFARRLWSTVLPLPNPLDEAAVAVRARMPPLAHRALDLLGQIRFQQTHTTGWSGTLQASVASLGAESSRSYAREPMTFPDVVASFRDFAAQLATSATVIVGIDELDKMEGEDEAERFLNDIKAIFGVRNCYYLLSVSEDALSRFERRGVPLRDAFDSSFDEIVIVAPLRLADAKALVRRRVIGVPVPFVALAHCLAGGLPRDLLRVMRRLVQDAENEPDDRSLASLAERLLRDDLLRKVTATSVTAQRRDRPDQVAALIGWATQLKAARGQEALQQLCHIIATDPDGDEGLGAYAYFVATLLAFFDGGLDEERMGRALDASHVGSVDHLAEARQAFALSARAAWVMVAAFCEEWGLPVVDPPMRRPASAADA